MKKITKKPKKINPKCNCGDKLVTVRGDCPNQFSLICKKGHSFGPYYLTN